jgi:hypothetical protein
MNFDTSELWREHEFVVRVKRLVDSEIHVISVYGENELLEDRVFHEAENRLTKHIFTDTTERQEKHFSSRGQVVLTRTIEPGEIGTFVVKELSHGSMRLERTIVKRNDGRKVLLTENQFASNGVKQRESETHFAPNGKDPCISNIKSYAKDGRVTRYEQVIWHGENRPAVTEATEYDWYGVPETQVKTLHNSEGDPLWETRVELKT